MARKPVIGYMECPHCKVKHLVIWDGNRKFACFACKKPFVIHRTKMEDVKRVKRDGDEHQ